MPVEFLSDRADGDGRLWSMLADATPGSQQAMLEGLLVVADGAHASDLERLRKGPADPTGKGLRLALRRVAPDSAYVGASHPSLKP